MTKYYFYNDESCYELDYWYGYMEEHELEELELIEAVKVKDNSYFFCKAYGEIGEKGDCGKACPKYKPRNGKSGICTHTGSVYENTGKKITIRLTDLE